MLGDLSLIQAILVFAAAAVVIAVAGVRMVDTADRLADRTGLGEAVTGAVLLGATTSLSGALTSITAAADGYANLAVSNAIGGIAVQTWFLAVGDVLYRRANLEHAAASGTNLVQCAVLLGLLTLPLMAVALPETAVWSVHPVSVLLIVGYVAGLRLARTVRQTEPWGPKQTPETWTDQPEEPRGGRPMRALVLRFSVLAIVLAAAGVIVARTGERLSLVTGLGESVVGVLLTAVVTSLPELVTTLAAIRRKALTLAVGGIIGGNTFDVLFLAMSDAAYRQGSIYHVVADSSYFVITLTMLMTAILLVGLLRRERHGIANIGFESALIFVLYLLGVGYLTAAA